MKKVLKLTLLSIYDFMLNRFNDYNESFKKGWH